MACSPRTWTGSSPRDSPTSGRAGVALPTSADRQRYREQRRDSGDTSFDVTAEIAHYATAREADAAALQAQRQRVLPLGAHLDRVLPRLADVRDRGVLDLARVDAIIAAVAHKRAAAQTARGADRDPIVAQLQARDAGARRVQARTRATVDRLMRERFALPIVAAGHLVADATDNR